MENTLTIKNQNTNFKVDPVQFTVWIFLVSIVMLFAGFTSAYMVRKAEGNWLEFELPDSFLYSIYLIIASSVFMALAQLAQRDEQRLRYIPVLLSLSFFTGAAFIASQFQGWQVLNDGGIYLVGNPSGSFLYIISGLHVLHVAAGLLVLLVLMLRSVLLPKEEYKTLKINSGAIYWHFVGILWIYLYIFFKYV